MSSLFVNKKLIKNGGGEASAEVALKGKIVGLYFSAHWCPPCRMFTPVLKDFYSELEASGELEIVFLSSDRSESDLNNYLTESHGKWYYLPFGDPLVQQLKAKFGVCGIPTLVVVKADGTVVDKEADEAISEGKKSPSQLLDEWKKA